MRNSDKEILFNEFLKSWKDDFESAIAFVRYIYGYYLLDDIYYDLELINPLKREVFGLYLVGDDYLDWVRM